MTTPPDPPQGDPAATAPPAGPPAPPADPPAEPDDKTPFTAADRAALKKALDAERKLHRDAVARVTALEQAGASEADKAWQAKITAATDAANTRLVKMAARAALSTAGLAGKPERLVALLDLSAVTVDDEGEVSGLSDQVAALKTEYPGLFGGTNGTPPKPGSLNTGSRQPGPGKPKTFADQMATQLRWEPDK
jgi:hypothetical protein